MLCESCKKNDANVHITKVINGIKQELDLCEKCAKEKGEFNFNPQIEFSSSFTFQNVLPGIMDYISNSSGSKNSFDIKCENCGNTYLEFKNRGFMGCSECYNRFSSTIIPVIKRVQGSVEHTGKIPQKLVGTLIEKKKLNKLKEELQRAIAVEEYERAAEIRDMIKKIENKKN